MSTILFTHIRQLVNTREDSPLLKGAALANLPCIQEAFLLVEDGVIAEYGAMHDLELLVPQLPREVADAAGSMVLPAWCDSHTHLVFARSREEEFVCKLKGMSYAEIAAQGGGILHSAGVLNDYTEDTLFTLAWARLQELSALGTGAIEIKSGYGLTVDGELKMLRVIKRLKERSNLQIRATFLGAHAYPERYKDDHAAYLDLIIHEMLPIIGREKLADYIDVFCEEGFFSPEEMEIVCTAGMQYGLRPKLHVNQLNSIGGIRSGLRMNALSLDHLETLTENDIADLSFAAAQPGAPVCTLLPTAAFFLRMPYQPARALIDAGTAIALASDFNPGSSPSGNMNFVVSLSCIGMKLLPEEAINAATLNGAHAMGAGDLVGSITVGKKANLIFTRPVPSLAWLPYAFGTNCISRVMINGEWVSR